ncbi:MAG: hypothetical protein ABID38_05770 [Candidatus Diapherotrites archaeon]
MEIMGLSLVANTKIKLKKEAFPPRDREYFTLTEFENRKQRGEENGHKKRKGNL